MKELIHPNDPYHMNWVEGATEWGTVKCPGDLSVEVTTEHTADTIIEHYTFTNITDHDVFTYLRNISIYTTFNEDYAPARICVHQRCHTHIFCGENVSYIMGLRMGGQSPHLGLVLTEGSISGYSIERDLSRNSNDRGDFILHPTPVALVPGESFTISWTLFWHYGKQDFYKKIRQYNPRFIDIQAENYTVFENEQIDLTIRPVFPFTEEDVKLTANGEALPYEIENGVIHVRQKAQLLGEMDIQVNIQGVQTHCNLLVLPQFQGLLEKRCEFIVKKQQYHNEKSGLDGAYLAYDNEEGHLYYNLGDLDDFNGGRERVAMGVLLANYLRHNENKEFEQSLKKYRAYIERELFDCKTGIVYNDYQRSTKRFRLYNYPWITIFYLELYHLYNDKDCLVYAYRSLKAYYEQGGSHFYAFPIPFAELYQALEKEKMDAEKHCILDHFRQHCDVIIENGLYFPEHEVVFEQSISFPATYILLQMYKVTGDETYLKYGKFQLDALELFSGQQPDHHLYEAAIRHWDGFWFGKRKQYGDTFPHYWSALNALAFTDYAQSTGDKAYLKKADASLRACLSLFKPDGSASCACVYPASVNGSRTCYYDPLANDQDWAMYFMSSLTCGN